MRDTLTVLLRNVYSDWSICGEICGKFENQSTRRRCAVLGKQAQQEEGRAIFARLAGQGYA